MAQRWMQSKMQIAKAHGTTRSGAGRAMGYVLEDLPGRAPQDKDPAPIKERHVERHGNRIVEVSPVLRKVRGTIMVKKDPKPAGRSAHRNRATA